MGVVRCALMIPGAVVFGPVYPWRLPREEIQRPLDSDSGESNTVACVQSGCLWLLEMKLCSCQLGGFRAYVKEV